MGWLSAAFDWQSRAVVARHMRVYLKNWHTSFLPPVLEPDPETVKRVDSLWSRIF